MRIIWSELRVTAGLCALAATASCVPAAGSTALAPKIVAAKAPVQQAEPSSQDIFWQKASKLLAPVSSTPADPFEGSDMTSEDYTRSLNCLTAAIYYEARSEPEDGQRAVAQVVLNRVRHPAFPNTVCGVVFQGHERSTGCQFSFTCDGSMDRPREQMAWLRSRRIAAEALNGEVYAPVGNATHYHTLAIHPYWANYLQKSAIVGSHIFYRWAGTAGEASAFRQRYGGLEPVQALWNANESVPTVHRGSLPSWVEEVEVEDGDGKITIHRGSNGGAAHTAAFETGEQFQGEEPDGGSDRSHDFGVKVHVGSEPAAG